MGEVGPCLQPRPREAGTGSQSWREGTERPRKKETVIWREKREKTETRKQRQAEKETEMENVHKHTCT